MQIRKWWNENKNWHDCQQQVTQMNNNFEWMMMMMNCGVNKLTMLIEVLRYCSTRSQNVLWIMCGSQLIFSRSNHIRCCVCVSLCMRSATLITIPNTKFSSIYFLFLFGTPSKYACLTGCFPVPWFRRSEPVLIGQFMDLK